MGAICSSLQRKKEGDRESEKVFLCLGETDRGEKGHEIYINLIMLLVPCVFLLELTAGREWRDRQKRRHRERDREIH